MRSDQVQGHHQEKCQRSARQSALGNRRSAPQSAQKCVCQKNASLLYSVLGENLDHEHEELECQRSALRSAKETIRSALPPTVPLTAAQKENEKDMVSKRSWALRQPARPSVDPESARRPPRSPPSAAQEDQESARTGRRNRDLPGRAAPNTPAGQRPPPGSSSRLKSSGPLATFVLDKKYVASVVLAVFGPRRAACCSCLPTHSSLNFGGNGAEEWWKDSARTMRTVCRSCFNHDRSRRSRRRLAAPVSRSPCSDLSTAGVFRKSYSRKANFGGKRLGGGGSDD